MIPPFPHAEMKAFSFGGKKPTGKGGAVTAHDCACELILVHTCAAKKPVPVAAFGENEAKPHKVRALAPEAMRGKPGVIRLDEQEHCADVLPECRYSF